LPVGSGQSLNGASPEVDAAPVSREPPSPVSDPNESRMSHLTGDQPHAQKVWPLIEATLDDDTAAVLAALARAPGRFVIGGE